MKCSPGKKLSCGNCFTKKELNCILVSLKRIFGSNENSKYRNHSYRNKNHCEIWSEVKVYLDKYLNDHTNNEWIQDAKLMSEIQQNCPNLYETIRFFSIRPKFGGNITTGWLNNEDIDLVMAQYQNVYKDLVYLGTFSADMYELGKQNSTKNIPSPSPFLISKDKCVSMVINTGNMSSGGVHWCSLFRDANSNEIELFDSQTTGVLSDYSKSFKQTLKWLCSKRYTLKQTTLVHQYDEYMCGVFSILFILCRNQGIPFDAFNHHPINFEDIKEFRDIIFA